jgi:hypothetical protein
VGLVLAKLANDPQAAVSLDGLARSVSVSSSRLRHHEPRSKAVLLSVGLNRVNVPELDDARNAAYVWSRQRYGIGSGGRSSRIVCC